MTAAEVIALAPDAASVKAGEALASPRKWLALAGDDKLIWGECTGSGKQPYLVCADLATLAYKCTCPSRKFPCKHVLGALLAAVGGGVAAGTAPDWAQGWRSEREAKAQRAAAAPVAPPAGDASAAAAAKRAQTRERRVATGLADCDRWLRDIVRLGLAHARIAPAAFWESRAARLVDAQCPGVARRVRALAGVAVSGPGWEDRTLAAIGEIALLCAAYARIDALAADVQADVRRAIGWTQTHDETVARAFDVVAGSWTVIGVRTTADDDRLIVRRSWLQSVSDGRPALVLQFAPRGMPLGDALSPGGCLDATLTYVQSAAPLRAIVVERRARQSGSSRLHAVSIAAALDTFARALAGDPWLDRYPLVLDGVTPQRAGETAWVLRDDQHALAIAADAADPRPLLALSGGGPLRVAGEWDGATFVPLVAWSAGRAVALAP